MRGNTSFQSFSGFLYEVCILLRKVLGKKIYMKHSVAASEDVSTLTKWNPPAKSDVGPLVYTKGENKESKELNR